MGRWVGWWVGGWVGWVDGDTCCPSFLLPSLDSSTHPSTHLPKKRPGSEARCTPGPSWSSPMSAQKTVSTAASANTWSVHLPTHPPTHPGSAAHSIRLSHPACPPTHPLLLQENVHHYTMSKEEILECTTSHPPTHPPTQPTHPPTHPPTPPPEKRPPLHHEQGGNPGVRHLCL